MSPRGVTPLPAGPGQESVWDYPRPPRLDRAARPIRVVFNGVTLAATSWALRSGWITSDVVGPFKGEPGSWGW